MRISRTTLALLWRGIILLLAGYVAFIAWILPPADVSALAPARRTAAPSQPVQPTSETPPRADVDHTAIAEYPLFYPSRKRWNPPPPPETPPVVEEPSALTGYALVGVIISNESRSALVRPPGASKVLTLGEGQELGGWTLKEITRDRLRFAAGTATYDMSFPKPSEVRP